MDIAQVTGFFVNSEINQDKLKNKRIAVSQCQVKCRVKLLGYVAKYLTSQNLAPYLGGGESQKR